MQTERLLKQEQAEVDLNQLLAGSKESVQGRSQGGGKGGPAPSHGPDFGYGLVMLQGLQPKYSGNRI